MQLAVHEQAQCDTRVSGPTAGRMGEHQAWNMMRTYRKLYETGILLFTVGNSGMMIPIVNMYADVIYIYVYLYMCTVFLVFLFIYIYMYTHKLHK